MKPIAALAAAFFTHATVAAHAQDFPSPDGSARASESRPSYRPTAARSVNLRWGAPAASVFVNEITVDDSAPGSTFMACGFVGGYFGLQEAPDKNKSALFSLWDEGQGGALQSVEVLASGDSVVVSRFGSEGTGARATWPVAWKTGRTYKMLVRATPDGDKVIYSAFIAGPDIPGWKLIASLRLQGAPSTLQGLYSFVEDTRRDGKSVLQPRRARFGNGWVRTPEKEWVSITQGRFGAGSNSDANINAGITPTPEENKGRALPAGTPQKFFLATGGLTRQSTPLNSTLEIAPLTLPN